MSASPPESPKGKMASTVPAADQLVGVLGSDPPDIDVLDLGNLSPRSESLSYSRRVVTKMQQTAGTSDYIGKPQTLQKGTIKVSGHNLDCELVQYNCGKIDGSGNDGPGAVPVYMHVLRMTLPANSVGAMAYRPILEKPPANGIDKSKPIHDWLFAENWALEKIGVGAGLNLGFSGRSPASADRKVAEPFVQNVDVNADSTTSGYIWAEMFAQVQEQRQRFEEAALAFAERTADERVAYRGLLQAKKEKAEELARPDKFWKAVKDGKIKTAEELMKRKYIHTKPPSPLPNIKDGSGWTPLHWGAYKGNRELCTVLIRHKAMLMEPDTCGNTPLHLACFNGASEAAVFLAEQLGREGVDGGTNKGNKFGSTPIMEAASNGHADLAASLVKLKIDWIPSSETGTTLGAEKVTKGSARSGGGGSRPRLISNTEQGKSSKQMPKPSNEATPKK